MLLHINRAMQHRLVSRVTMGRMGFVGLMGLMGFMSFLSFLMMGLMMIFIIMISNIHPTGPQRMSGVRCVWKNSFVSLAFVSPTNNNMVGVRVESNFTKQYTSTMATTYNIT